MKEFILNLAENYTNQVFVDLKEFGLEVTWVSENLPHLIAVKTDKSKEELENHFLIESVTESSEGTVFV